MSTSSIHNFIKKTPLLFPLIAVFHLFVAFHAVWTFRDMAFSFTDWTYPLVLLVYSVLWLLVCSMKKWTAYVYIFFTIANLLAAYFIAPRMNLHYEAAFFPADVVCCFFILVYFRRFE